MDSWGRGPLVLRHKGKVWRFEFSDMFGPVLLTQKDDPSDRQPDREDHPFRDAFQPWFAAGKKHRAVRTKRGRLRFYLCHMPREERLP
jgi:hypothetical protein